MPRPTIPTTQPRKSSALARCLTIVSPHDVTVLLGDFNATVRDDIIIIIMYFLPVYKKGNDGVLYKK
jgi:hypothetical protein